MSMDVVEASICDIQRALSDGLISGPCLNSIPILNPSVFDEAAASDARRASGNLLGRLDGVPYTLKDSMMYKGMTCSSGAPAFKNLIANSDSFVAEQLRGAGAVCIGRTNTPPMMASGMHRGVHGRAESPYNLEYLTAAFSSGSSNGSATSTAASFAAFGLGSETVSSGRSPASNNALVAYTPSRTVISPRGTWPLYPTCDVLVPHTRTVEDMLAILDVLTIVDSRKDGDFWREQNYVDIPFVERPQTFLDLKESGPGSLKGKRIAVPLQFIGGHDAKAKPFVVSQDVIDLWKRAKNDLEAAGATVIETDFPLVSNYEDDSTSGIANNVVGIKPEWNLKERGELVAYLWDDFLKANGDPNVPSLAVVDGANIFPRPEGYIPDKYIELKNMINYPGIVETVRNRNGKSVWEIDGLAEALPALEAQRKRDLEEWMDQKSIDLIVFPACGDVGRADLDTNDESARHALQNGVKYSTGNRAIRHMGVPTCSVSMGVMQHCKMPVNLTFAGKHGSDVKLLEYVYDFEQRTKRRIAPPVTPALEADHGIARNTDQKGNAPVLEVHSAERLSKDTVRLTGVVSISSAVEFELEARVDGHAVPMSHIKIEEGRWTIDAHFAPYEPKKATYGGYGEVVDKVVVVLLARCVGHAPVGKLVLIGQEDTV